MRVKIPGGERSWNIYYYIIDTRRRRVISEFRAPAKDVEIVVKEHRAVVRSIVAPKNLIYFEPVYLPPGASPKEACEIAARHSGMWPPHPDVPVKPVFLC